MAANPEPALQLIEVSEECLVRIFGFLDIKHLGRVALVCKLFERLQQEGSLWYSLLPHIKSLDLDLPFKERVQLWIIPICEKEERVRLGIILSEEVDSPLCILGLYHKTIKPTVNIDPVIACQSSLGHPLVRNGSFVVCSENLEEGFCTVVIKDKNGHVDDKTCFFSGEDEDVKEFQENEGTPSQFHEYQWISYNNNSMLQSACPRLAKASKLLRGQISFFTEVSEGCIVKIFGFLDKKRLGKVALVCKLFERLQREDSLWSSLFPNIKSFDLDLPCKERVRRGIIPIGQKGRASLCILDLYNKTIKPTKGNIYLHHVACVLSLGHLLVPNDSFVVYSESLESRLCRATIKTKDGTIDRDFYFNEGGREVDELRENEGTSSQFHEYKWISYDNNSVPPSPSPRLAKASELLRSKKHQ